MQTGYDAIVIGTGQSGPSLAVELAKAGRRVAIIERDRFGGTCVNIGCIPTKALVASARVAHVVRRAADYGVTTSGDMRVDMKAVKARKDAIVRRSNTGVEGWLKNTDNLTVYEGHGRFAGPHTVHVGDTVLDADQVFVDVGARAYVPDMPGLETVDFLTNSSMMDIDVLPEHLIIIGGSYIGLEFAQMYRRFGSQVTVVEMADRLIRRDDEDVSQAVKEILEAEGVTVRLNAECIGASKQGDQVSVSVDCRDGSPAITGAICSSRSGDDQTPTTSASTRPAWNWTMRVCRRRRPASHQCRGGLGHRRLQRPRRLHTHVLQQLRDRGCESAARRSPSSDRPDHRLRALRRSSPRARWHDRASGARVWSTGPHRHATDDEGWARRRER